MHFSYLSDDNNIIHKPNPTYKNLIKHNNNSSDVIENMTTNYDAEGLNIQQIDINISSEHLNVLNNINNNISNLNNNNSYLKKQENIDDNHSTFEILDEIKNYCLNAGKTSLTCIKENKKLDSKKIVVPKQLLLVAKLLVTASTLTAIGYSIETVIAYKKAIDNKLSIEECLKQESIVEDAMDNIDIAEKIVTRTVDIIIKISNSIKNPLELKKNLILFAKSMKKFEDDLQDIDTEDIYLNRSRIYVFYNNVINKTEENALALSENLSKYGNTAIRYIIKTNNFITDINSKDIIDNIDNLNKDIIDGINKTEEQTRAAHDAVRHAEREAREAAIEAAAQAEKAARHAAHEAELAARHAAHDIERATKHAANEAERAAHYVASHISRAFSF